MMSITSEPLGSYTFTSSFIGGATAAAGTVGVGIQHTSELTTPDYQGTGVRFCYKLNGGAETVWYTSPTRAPSSSLGVNAGTFTPDSVGTYELYHAIRRAFSGQYDVISTSSTLYVT